MKITNFKVGSRIVYPNDVTSKRLYTLSQRLSLKFINNFLVYRNKYTFVIFAGGYVNITGICDLNEAKRQVPTILSLIFGTELVLKPLIVQNISATCRLTTQVNLLNCKIASADCKYFPESSRYLKKLGIESEISTFPAVKLFTDVGTALIFASGKCNIVGCNQEQHIYWIRNVCLNAVGISKSIKQEMNI